VTAAFARVEVRGNTAAQNEEGGGPMIPKSEPGFFAGSMALPPFAPAVS
jgi:hypothetical protein